MENPIWKASMVIELRHAGDDPQAIDEAIHEMFERGDPDDEAKAVIVVSEIEKLAET